MKNKAFFCAAGAVAALLLAYILLGLLRRDTQPPEILMTSTEITVSVQDPRDSLLQGVAVRDDTDGDLTDALVIESVYGIGDDGRATVRYAVADSAGNVTKAERSVYYSDYVSPRLTLTGALIFEYGTPFDVLDHIRAGDLFEGDISRRIKTSMLSSGTSVGEQGTHEVQFRVTNAMGDSCELVLPVEVYPVGMYNAQLTLREYLVYLPVGAPFDALDYGPELQLKHEMVDLHPDAYADARLQIHGKVDTQTPGVYAVTYNADCWRSGHLYTGCSRLIVVVEE